MDTWVADIKFGTYNSIRRLLMRILCNFGFGTQITKLWSVEGGQYHNPDNAAGVADEGQPTPSS